MRLKELERLVYKMGSSLPSERQYLTEDELQSSYSVPPPNLTQIKEFAEGQGLQVIEASSSKRAVRVAGTVKSLCSVFHTKLKRYSYRGIPYDGRKGWINIPHYVAPVIQGVHGLDDRPQFTPSFYRSIKYNKKNRASDNQNRDRLFTPLEIAKLYHFPTIDSNGKRLDGSGQCIALIELGGGFYHDEVIAYFQELGVAIPKISCVSIGGAKNNPGQNKNQDGEVMIDIAISGSVAPGAEIIVYFSKGSTNGFYNAIDQAVHDTKHKPSIISISWGSAEGAWGQLLKPTNHSLMNAAVLGRTVICATGDYGSSDLRPDEEGVVDDQSAHIEFPASSPFVLACGGTKLFSSNAQKIRSEVVWNDGKDGTTGGGVSEYIKRPKYQDGLRNIQSVNKRQIHGRCIPDIAAFASPGYNIPVHGQKDPKGRGGTSAAAPLWAALIALINQSVGSPAGFINPLLYEHSAFVGVLSDITKGNNIAKDVRVRAKDKMIKGSVKGYYARIGWDACTGLGTPNGLKLLKALSGKIFRGTKRGKTEYQHLGPRN